MIARTLYFFFYRAISLYHCGPIFNLLYFSCPAVPANIVTAPANTPAKVSDDVTITCMAVGNLPIDVTWFNGSRQMTDNSRVSITDNIETEHFRVNSTLVVKSLVLQDTKQYSCRASNQFGSDRKTFQIVAQREKLLDFVPFIR